MELPRGELALGACLPGAIFLFGDPQVAQRCAVLLLMPAFADAWAVGRDARASIVFVLGSGP